VHLIEVVIRPSSHRTPSGNHLLGEKRIPQGCGIDILLIFDDLATSQREHLNPFVLEDPPSGPHAVSFTTEHDNRVMLGNKRLRLEAFRVEQLTKGLKETTHTIATVSRTTNREIRRSRHLPVDVV